MDSVIDMKKVLLIFVLIIIVGCTQKIEQCTEIEVEGESGGTIEGVEVLIKPDVILGSEFYRLYGDLVKQDSINKKKFTISSGCLDETSLLSIHCPASKKLEEGYEIVDCSETGKVCHDDKCVSPENTVTSCREFVLSESDVKMYSDSNSIFESSGIEIRLLDNTNSVDYLNECKGDNLISYKCADTLDSAKEIIECELGCEEGHCIKPCSKDCSESGMKCINGECGPFSCEINEKGEGIEEYRYDDGSVEFRTFEPSCEDSTIVYQPYCNEKNKVSLERKECEKGLICLKYKNKCGLWDQDADTIPDNEDECVYTTTIDEPVNTNPSKPGYGCTCAQQTDLGIKERFVSSTITPGSDNFQEDTPCEEIESYTPPECVHNGKKYPSQCCNHIKDNNEVLLNCGGECPKCSGFCTKIVDGGELSALFIPNGYYYDKEDTMKYYETGEINNNVWIERAMDEAFKLVTTPPFCESVSAEIVYDSNPMTDFSEYSKCEGVKVEDKNNPLYGHVVEVKDGEFESKITVYRVDAFGIDLETQELLNDRPTSISFTGASLRRKYSAFCPDTTLAYFLSVIPVTTDYFDEEGTNLGGVADYFGSRNIIFDGEGNYISHETGHSLCKLSDEGNSGVLAYMPNVDTNPVICSVNADNNVLEETCESYPFSLWTEQVPEGKDVICKWHENHPDHEDYLDDYLKYVYLAIYDFVPSDFSGEMPFTEFNNAGCKLPSSGSAALPVPEYPVYPSLMNFESKTEFYGEGPYGTGGWNQISYVICKHAVDLFS